MSLTPGTRLGPYEVTAQIGAGGIGEVYKARDTRLERTVAIKVLPEALAADAQFRERFDREARAISQLDHPNICSRLAYRALTPSEPPVYRTTILPPDGARFSAQFTGGGTASPADRFALSPDGRLLAFVATGADRRVQLWVRRLDTLTAQPLAGTDGASSPFWSPDAQFIAFYAEGKLKKINAAGGPPLTLTDAYPAGGGGGGGAWNRDDVILFSPRAGSGLFRVAASGGMPSAATMLDPAIGERGHLYPFFLPDGRHFLYVTRGTATSPTSVGGVHVTALDSTDRKEIVKGVANTWVLPLGREGRKPTPVLEVPFNQVDARFSPDGRWIAYQSNESGRSEVYVMPFAGAASTAVSTDAAGGKWQVSSAGGSGARWRRDGKELFYLSADNMMMAAATNGQGSAFEVGAPRPLFEIRPRLAAYLGYGVGSNFDVSPDGQRFLVNAAVAGQTTAPITLVVNWTAALKQ